MTALRRLSRSDAFKTICEAIALLLFGTALIRLAALASIWMGVQP